MQSETNSTSKYSVEFSTSLVHIWSRIVFRISNIPNSETLQIEQIILHPNFEYSTGFVIYDIAIAQMNDALPLITYRIWPIRLPRAFEEIPDEYGVVLGYGETDDPRLKSGAILMGVHLIKQNCQVADHFFCLGHPDGNKDSCDV